LDDPFDRSYVDPEFEGGGTNGGRGTVCLFESSFSFLADLPGQVPMVGPEFIRHTIVLAGLPQEIGVELHICSAVWEDEIACAAKLLVQALRN
jgi:hypothetical protein